MNQTANRVTAATLGGALTVLLVWVLDLVAGIKPTAEVIVAMTTVVQAIVQAAYSLFTGFQSGKQQQGGFVHPVMLVVLLGASAVLMGCASTGGPRVAFASGAETAKLLYVASAQMYGACHSAAEDAADQLECWQEKNARGDELGKALPFLHAAGEGIITYDQAASDENLARARAVLLALMPALTAYLTAEEQQAVGWIEL